MESVKFVLSNIGSDDMPMDDQGRFVVNQATAIIVAAWLEHATKMVEQGITSHPGSAFDFFVKSQELPTVINDVQQALRNI